jgi:hypothetical protein
MAFTFDYIPYGLQGNLRHRLSGKRFKPLLPHHRYLSIEQYCKRRLLCKKRFEFFPFYWDYIIPLRDYPVWEILAVYRTHTLKKSIIVENDFY